MFKKDINKTKIIQSKTSIKNVDNLLNAPKEKVIIKKITLTFD